MNAHRLVNLTLTAGLTAALCVAKLEQAGLTTEAGTVLVTGATGGVGSIAVALLASLGDDLKFVFITSKVALVKGEGLTVEVKASEATKCERCWHYSDDVGHNPAHPTLCGRCDSNLHGDGEVRHFA